MKPKELTPEQAQARATKKAKEIAKWEKQKAKPKKSYYMIYLVFIISLIYISDEIASQIGTLMKTEIANDLMARFGDSSVGTLDLIGMIAIPFQALAILYKPLADRFGRKIFLVVNTFGMGFSMFLIFLSNNIPLYVIANCITQFFVPHDMQVVYIMESAPSKLRARLYSVVKCVATLGVLLVPLLRRLLMSDVSQWRLVYLIPAIVAMAASLIALLFARETDAYIDSRLRYLRMSEEEIAREKAEKNSQNAQGGVISALRFVSKHKQLKWLYIVSIFGNTGFIITMYYQVIMSYGYAKSYVANGLFPEMGDEVMNAVGVGPVTAALFMFPVGSAAIQLLMGFICDLKSRKAAAVTVSAVCVISFICFTLGASLAWSPLIVGFFCGLCVGAFWSNGDIEVMMIGESSPTNLRSSIMSSQFLAMGAGVAFSYVVGLPLITFLGNSVTAVVSLGVAVPGLVLSLIAMILKTHDTRGVNLDKVTGCEWD